MTEMNSATVEVQEIEQIEPVVALVPESEVVPVEEPKPELIRYEYQPVDELDRPLGAKQVFEGKDWNEITDKVAKSNRELIRLNRELNKKIRLGDVQTDEIPENITRMQEQLSMKPTVLTPEEKLQLSRDLLDPDKFEEASARILEASLGAKPEVIRDTIIRQANDIAAIKAEREAYAFVNSNKDYYVCKDNFETMTSWMVKNNLQPTKQNFQYAFDTLKAVGLLLEAPIVREEVVPVVEPTPLPTPENSHPVTEPVNRIIEQEPSQPKRQPKVASGLNRSVASDIGAAPKSTKLTVDEIERMPSDVYKKRLLTEPNFAKEVNEVLESKKRG